MFSVAIKYSTSVFIPVFKKPSILLQQKDTEPCMNAAK